MPAGVEGKIDARRPAANGHDSTMKTDLAQTRKALKTRSRPVLRHEARTPAEVLREAADWCEAAGYSWDSYGSGPLIEDFEAKVADLLGFPAARFMPSGKAAQNIAMKVWCERAGLNHFGMHPTSHLELHEGRAYQHLFGLRATLLGPRNSPLLAEHLKACPEALAALLIELPIREAGGQLPEWGELKELKVAAEEREIRLHLDGARLFETAAYYGRSLAKICSGFDSAYVSFYKGIGGLSGAMLLGDESFIEEAKVWQVRCGAELFTLAPNVASAAMQFDHRLDKMPEYYERAVALASVLERTERVRTLPAVPQTNMMHVYLPWDMETALAARDHVAEELRLWLFDSLRPAATPGFSYYEWYVGDAACAVPVKQVELAFARFIERADD